MSDESSDAFKIHRAPNGKFYVRENGEAICLPNGSLRYFETQRDPSKGECRPRLPADYSVG
jgi:hypothetical protein